MSLVANPLVLAVLEQQFVTGAIITALAYLVGALVFVVSRAVVDTLSALILRPLFLKAYRWEDFKSLSVVATNRKYRTAIDKVVRETKHELIQKEVGRRRQRGRLIRTLLVPVGIWAWSIHGGSGLAIAVPSIVAVYAYAEVTIYQEARLAA